MKLKIHSAELNRMMKTIVQCIDTRDMTGKANISIVYDNGYLAIRATNGQVSAVMTTPLLGGDGESFCVDGAMFARVCAMCNGEIEISTDEKNCTIRGAGRTRLPIVNAKIPAFEQTAGDIIKMDGEQFSSMYSSVAHAISADQGRIVLTGVLIETDGREMSMVALDGFQMAVERALCYAEPMKVIVPGTFMKLISGSIQPSDTIRIITDGKKVQVSTQSMMLSCGLLAGEYPDYKRLLPTEFKTECVLDGDALRNALKSGSVVNNKNNLVKLKITENDLTLMSNSEQADYEAEVPCITQGNDMTIAFNQKYLANTIGSINSNDLVLKFNGPTLPCIAQRKNGDGMRLVLPVRTVG